MHHGRNTPLLDELDGVARHAAPSPPTRKHVEGFVGEDVRGVVITCVAHLRDETLVLREGDDVAVAIEVIRVTRLLQVTSHSQVPGVSKRTLRGSASVWRLFVVVGSLLRL